MLSNEEKDKAQESWQNSILGLFYILLNLHIAKRKKGGGIFF